MLNEKLQNDFISNFHNLTKQNARKILKKIESGEDDFFDDEIQNSFILGLNPHLNWIKSNGEDSLKDDGFIIHKKPGEKLTKELDSGIWEDNFPYYNGSKKQTLEYNHYDEFGNKKIDNQRKLLLQRYDIFGNPIGVRHIDDLTFKPEDEKNIRYNLLSSDSRKIASNIYDEQIDYFQNIAEKYKNEDNFLDIIGKEFKKIIDFNRVKNYGECLADTIFQSNKNSCFNAYLEDKKIKGYKKRVTESDDRVSDICRHNASQGFIPFEDNFISGHDAPPGHYGCRCHLEFKTEENLDFNIENYILKNKQITDLMEEERIQKEQEKREKEAEKERKRKEKERLEEEKRQKFIEKNEGNVWYLDSSKRLTTDFTENVGHAALCYIYEGEEYIFSYGNGGTEDIYPSQNGDVFLDEQPGRFVNEDENITNSIVPGGKKESRKVNYDIIEIGKENVDVKKMHKWIGKQKKNPPKYSALNNNCSTMVEKALKSGDFIVQNFDNILPTPHNLTNKIENSKIMYELMENGMGTK